MRFESTRHIEEQINSQCDCKPISSAIYDDDRTCILLHNCVNYSKNTGVQTERERERERAVICQFPVVMLNVYIVLVDG